MRIGTQRLRLNARPFFSSLFLVYWISASDLSSCIHRVTFAGEQATVNPASVQNGQFHYRREPIPDKEGVEEGHRVERKMKNPGLGRPGLKDGRRGVGSRSLLPRFTSFHAPRHEPSLPLQSAWHERFNVK
jgi:hypothetical protein